MAKLKVSPLHRVIDAGRWDAEVLVGRLVVVVHAAFLDEGFVPCKVKAPNSRRLAEEVGRTASTLSLRYAARQLAHRKDAAAALITLCTAQGSDRHVVFYAHVDLGDTAEGHARRAAHWKYVDVAAAVPLLSGCLDDTARALTSEGGMGTRLWRSITDGFCRRLLSDLCRSNGVPLEPSLTSLPTDILVSILKRLPDGKDLARVECTSKEMMRLVNQHDGTLWNAMYSRRHCPFRFSCAGCPLNAAFVGLPGAASSTTTTSWKERYAESWKGHCDLSISHGLIYRRICQLYCIHDELKDDGDGDDNLRNHPPEQEEEAVVAGGKKRTGDRRRSHQRVVWNHHERRRAGAIHSPSSRYRWNHR